MYVTFNSRRYSDTSYDSAWHSACDTGGERSQSLRHSQCKKLAKWPVFETAKMCEKAHLYITYILHVYSSMDTSRTQHRWNLLFPCSTFPSTWHRLGMTTGNSCWLTFNIELTCVSWLQGAVPLQHNFLRVIQTCECVTKGGGNWRIQHKCGVIIESPLERMHTCISTYVILPYVKRILYKITYNIHRCSIKIPVDW